MLLALFSACASFLAAFGTRALAGFTGAVDEVHGGRKIHKKATPLLGGIGIGCVLIAGILGVAFFRETPFDAVLTQRLLGFLAGIVVLMIGGFLDDRYRLPPLVQVLFPVLAAFLVIGTGTSILEVSSLHGQGVWSLDWWHAQTTVFGHVLSFVFPADILTLVWLLGVTYATKTMDGLDGLVTGHTVIGTALILLLASSPNFYQPSILLLGWIIFGGFLGFLPWNIHPARQFLGEAGSTLAGFSLGFLAIVSGAKVATAFMALGIPLVDFVLVILLRLRAGRSPFRGDDSHLHFRLLRLGFSQQQVAALFWMFASIFGLLALGLQTRGKGLLMVGIVCVTILLSLGAAALKLLSSSVRKQIFAAMCLVTLLVAAWSIKGLWHERVDLPQATEVSIHGRSLILEVADTQAKRTQGLSDRPFMRTDHGMLFVFPKPDRYIFWMPRMHFDLDIVWLNGDRVVDVARLPAPRSETEDPARYTPKAEGDRVLELVAGQAARYGIEEGKSVPELRIGTVSDKE